MDARVPRSAQNSHLLDERPLVLIPSLAVLLGLNEAIVLQQLHYWVGPKYGLSTNVIDEVKWAYNSYQEWQKQFPWWSVPTIQRTFTALERRGLIVARAFEAKNWDHKKWYTIDYDAYHALLVTAQAPPPIEQDNDLIDHIKLESSMIQSAPSDHIKLESSLTHSAPSDHIKLESSPASNRTHLNGTKTTPEINAKNDVVVALMTLGLTKRQAMAAVAEHRLTLAEVDQWEAWLATLDTSKTRPVAVFAAAITHQRLPTVPRVGVPHSVPCERDYPRDLPPNLPTGLVAECRASPPRVLLLKLWGAALQEVQPLVTGSDWETWLKPTLLLDLDADEAVIGTPNIFVRQEVEQRYALMLQGALENVLGRPVHMNVVIGGGVGA